jgi:hypothetical protein
MKVLLDTGITQSYLHMPYSHFTVGTTTTNWDFNGKISKTPIIGLDHTYTLDDATPGHPSHVHIDFWPPPPTGSKNEDFDVGDRPTIDTGVTPESVIFFVNNDDPMTPTHLRVNTGMHIYRKYRIAFDAFWGWFWLTAAI